ncbi:MAG: ABC transporter permease, partial [Alphaproteobacteria bacterium]
MLIYTVRRLLIMVPTLLVISAIVFVIIQLPPGDYLSTYINELRSQGEAVDEAKIAFLRQQYGLDQPLLVQYFTWLWNFIQGDFGFSFELDKPVTDVIGARMMLTIVVATATIAFTWLVSFPIGVYSATHQYSWSDYGLTFLGFLGLATPNF